MKKTLAIVLVAIMLLCMIPTFAVFATEDEFATIDSAEEFAEFTEAVNYYNYIPADGAIIKVTADLDMKDIVGFQPIDVMRKFTLDFDGHTVSNLAVSTLGANTNGSASGNKRFAGLIAHNVSNSAAILNLKLDNCLLEADARRVGVVAGYVNASVVNNVTVENCTVKATHTGESKERYAAGLIGSLDYSNYELTATLNNVVLESAEADAFGAVVGSFWKSTMTITSVTADNVTAKQGETFVQATFVGEQGYGLDCFTAADGAIVVNSTETATGYDGPGVVTPPDQPDEPDTPTTTTATQNTTKTPNTTKAPETTKAPTTDPVNDEEKGGCKSFAVGSVALVSIISLAGVSVLTKKKETK